MKTPEQIVIQKFAEKLAGEILTVYTTATEGTEGTRAQIMLKQPDGTEKNMGGRCKESIAEVIYDALTRGKADGENS